MPTPVGQRVVAHGGPDPAQLVGGHRGPHAASAHEHAALGPPVDHRPAHRLRGVGIVHGLGGVGAHVDDLVSGLAQVVGDGLLEDEARVVGADGDPHAHALRASSSRAAETILPGSKPNFFCSSLRGADAPNVRMPTARPPVPT